MFFQKKKEKIQIKPSTDGILSYRDFKRVSENENNTKENTVKSLAEKIKNKISSGVILNLIQDLRRFRIPPKADRQVSGMTKCDGLNSDVVLSSPRRRGSRFAFKFENFKQKSKTFFIDHIHLLFKSSAENHLRIQKCKKIKSGDVCNLQFDSYSQLKRYQKKVRILTWSTSSSLSLVLIFSLVLQILMPALPTRGATFYFDQSSWESSPNSNAKGVHPGDQSSFSDYESKDQYIAIQNPDPQDSAIILATASSNETKTQTSSVDFSAGTNNGTGVGGSGDNAYVFPCEFDHGGNVWEPTDGDAYDLDASGAIAIAGNTLQHCKFHNCLWKNGFCERI